MQAVEREPRRDPLNDWSLPFGGAHVDALSTATKRRSSHDLSKWRGAGGEAEQLWSISLAGEGPQSLAVKGQVGLRKTDDRCRNAIMLDVWRAMFVMGMCALGCCRA